jgi:hypothetical protein
MLRSKVPALAALAFVLALAAAGIVACGEDGGDGGEPSPVATAATATPSAEVGVAGAQSGVPVHVGSASADVGEDGEVEVQVLGVEEPGLGAFTFEIHYDPGIVTVSACTTHPDVVSFCNPDAGENAIRLTGAVAEGLTGDLTLGTLTFRCQAEGTSELDIVVEVLADGTIGNPREMGRVVTAGEIAWG